MKKCKQLTFLSIAGELFHQQCFVCSQCFRRFGHDEIFYEFEGRKYCEHDFQVLYAPACRRCGVRIGTDLN